ncbi:unnamed protein product [Lampetra fluviatilis]
MCRRRRRRLRQSAAVDLDPEFSFSTVRPFASCRWHGVEEGGGRGAGEAGALLPTSALCHVSPAFCFSPSESPAHSGRGLAAVRERERDGPVDLTRGSGALLHRRVALLLRARAAASRCRRERNFVL